ncbi:MAG: aminoacyl-tRNA hydrolase [Bacteroidales bacterium]|nr:aminoacyl-tRNA hydrolase [Bacteroidales bacterium]
MVEKEINKLLVAIRDYELSFTASRSSGPGGQHVNKASTKVEVRFNITASEILSEEQKSQLLENLANKITTEGELIVISQATRSQLDNKEKAIGKLLHMLEKALLPPKERKPTKPSKAAKEKRLDEKKRLSEKKEQRKPPEI